MNKAPLIGISRLRMGTDGHGITTLVAFHGCPLKCHYCLNPECNSPDGIKEHLTAEELYNRIKKDELYFLATRGGVCFGGGEPLLYSEYILDVLKQGANKWHTTIETSLNVEREHLERVLPYVNRFYIDIKDMDSYIYYRYTGSDNERVIENLKWLANQDKAKDVIIRIPLIYKFNTEEDQQNSVDLLKEMGYTRFDLFKYKTDKKILDRIKRRVNDRIRDITRLQGIIEDE